MNHRQFRDSNAVDWEVWEVMPVSAIQPLLDRRSRLRTHDDGPQKSRTDEWLLPKPGMSQGWLLFESRRERRRLVPIPEGWADLSVEGLEVLCGRAAPAPAVSELPASPAPDKLA